MRYSPDLIEGLARQPLKAHHDIPRSRRQPVHSLVQHFKVQNDSGQRLSRARVQFPGYAAPFLFHLGLHGPARSRLAGFHPLIKPSVLVADSGEHVVP